MPRSIEATLMECQNLQTSNIDCGKVQINNSDKPFVVKNNEGKVVFFIDNAGANQQIINTKTNFFDLYDAPSLGSENSILGIKNEKLAFSNSIQVSKVDTTNLNSIDAKFDSLTSDMLNCNNSTLKNLKCDNIKSNFSKFEELQATSIDCKALKVENIELEHISTKMGVMDNAKINALEANLISLNNLASTHAIVENFENQTANINNLKSNNSLFVDSKIVALEADEINVKDLTAKQMKTDELCAKNIKSASLNIEKNVYGSIDNPLCLNFTQTKEVQVTGNNIKIITSVPAGILNQSFIINGLDVNEDYIVNITSNNENMFHYVLINDGTKHKLNIKYLDRALRDSVLKINIMRI